MRGVDHQQSGMFSHISAERRVPKDHPLRAIRVMCQSRETGAPIHRSLPAHLQSPRAAQTGPELIASLDTFTLSEGTIRR